MKALEKYSETLNKGLKMIRKRMCSFFGDSKTVFWVIVILVMVVALFFLSLQRSHVDRGRTKLLIVHSTMNMVCADGIVMRREYPLGGVMRVDYCKMVRVKRGDIMSTFDKGARLEDQWRVSGSCVSKDKIQCRRVQ